MAERDAAEHQLIDAPATEDLRNDRVMVAGDPDPLAVLLDDFQDLEIVLADPVRCIAIVEAVAERNRRFQRPVVR